MESINLTLISKHEFLSFVFFLLSGSLGGEEYFRSWNEVHENFDTMGLQENLLRGIYAYGN